MENLDFTDFLQNTEQRLPGSLSQSKFEPNSTC
jgi:hypothetical protein